MHAEWTFIVWLIVVVLVFFLTRNYNITWWSSLVLALLAGLFVIMIGAGFCLRDLDGKDCDDESSDYRGGRRGKRKDNSQFVLSLLGFFFLISIVVIVIYLVQRVFDDQCPC